MIKRWRARHPAPPSDDGEDLDEQFDRATQQPWEADDCPPLFPADQRLEGIAAFWGTGYADLRRSSSAVVIGNTEPWRKR